MDRENFAGDEERLRALINDSLVSDESGPLTIDQSFISNNISDYEEDNVDVPTTDEEDELSEPEEEYFPSDPDDTDEDLDYLPSSGEEMSEDSNSGFVASTPKKRKISQGRPSRLENLISKRSRKLASNYLNKGFHVFTDNFFASIPLATRLYELGTYYTATIRANRKGLPDAIKSKFDVGITKFFKKGFLLLCGYRDKKSQKKQVLLISTASQATTSEVRRRVRRQAEEDVVNKPDVILEYNKYMGGIDISDMMVYAYLDERRTVKFWKKVVFSIFSRMILNTYILYKENVKLNGNAKPMTRFKFMESLIHELGREWVLVKKNYSSRSASTKQ